MKVSKAAKLCLEYHKSHSKENTLRAYKMVLTQLCEEFETENLEDITTEMVLSFWTGSQREKSGKPNKPVIPIYWHFSTSLRIT